MEQQSSNGPQDTPPLKLRKACDFCRQAKIRCEKTDGAPSCGACDARSIACIVSPRAQTTVAASRPSAADTPSYISRRQWSKAFLYDWIYGDTRSRDLLDAPHLWRDFVRKDCRKTVEQTITRLAKFEDLALRDTGSPQPTGPVHVFRPLPAEGELLKIVLTFSESTVPTLPLFREEIQRWLAERTYLDRGVTEDLPTWASLNIVLALGYKYHLLRYPDSVDDRTKCEGYLKNALDTIPRLILEPPCIVGVEALLGMVVLISCSLELPYTYSLLAVAIRKARTLGINRADIPRHEGAAPVASERLTRIFWAGYIMDQMTCSPQGLAPCEDDDNFEIDLPQPGNDAAGTITLPNGFRLPLFQHTCSLSIIKARIFKFLYSSKATTDANRRISVIQDLESELRDWRNSVHPECEESLERMEQTSFSRLAIVMLLLSYHHSVITLYRAAYLSPDSALEFPSAWTSACIRSARKTVHLVRYFPVHATLGIRSLLTYVFTSFGMFTLHILDDPWAESAQDDLSSLKELYTFISNLLQANSYLPADRQQIFAYMLRVCRYHLDSAERAIHGVESVDGFYSDGNPESVEQTEGYPCGA
ncbi:hypothetical protein BJX61DRAFT_134378 [Aspergillus egyptiacus]|nr:hypothetical protein BJX61DRAFT_134378 [Aspergillus egyptiacus]